MPDTHESRDARATTDGRHGPAPLTRRARQLLRGLNPGRRSAYLRIDGRPLAGPFHTVKSVKAAFARSVAACGIAPTIAVATFED